jgi:asparagine synthase (glutamine-hydrolysing)
VTALLELELAGVHDPRGNADADLPRRALPGAVVVEGGSLVFAAATPWTAGSVRAGLAGRVRGLQRLREKLGLPSQAPAEHVVAAGFARWDAELLDHLRGPFALVLWDRDAQRGLLAQDQLGGRSLFTFVDGSCVLFATEVAVLLRMLRRRPDPEELALAYHLVDHSVPDGRTLFRGIRRIGGGRHLELSPAGHAERRDWAPRYEPPLNDSRPQLAARLREELSAAIEDAVPTDRASALLLSGGLDSSVIAGLAAPRATGMHAISAAFPQEPELDETRWSRQVADYTGLPITTVAIERREPFEAAEAYLRTWQLPLPVPGIIIEDPLVAMARRLGADVVLDGQGGDELFGAAYYAISDRLRQLRPRQAWRLTRRMPWMGAAPPARQVWQVLMAVGVRGALPPGLHERLRRHRDARRHMPGWLGPATMRVYREAEDPWRWKRLDGPRGWAWLADTLTRGRETADIADYVRRRARVHGIEARSPLLDLGLVELTLRLPPETNFDPLLPRPLVRDALRGALPAEVLARGDKRDFAALHHRLLQTPQNMARVRRLLDERTAAVGAYVDLRRFHREVLDRPTAVGAPHWRAWAVHVWNVATAEMWLRNNVS